MRNCLDCFNCKINRSSRTLRCRIPLNSQPNRLRDEYFSNWFIESGYEKIVRLCSKNEVHKIKYRELFKTAKYCKYFEIDTPIQETP